MTKRTRSLNFAVVGCGRVSPRHLEALTHMETAKLVAVCDINAERADAAAERYGAKAYYDLGQLLKNPKIDVVSICTPSGFHPRLGMQVAKAGKHVLVEKPIGVKVELAQKLIKTCKSQGVKLGVILQNRYNPPMLDLKSLIESGRLGHINLASVCVRWFRPQSYYEDEWHGTSELDGGVLMNQAIHHIDALIWLLGMPSSVVSFSGTLAHTMEMEDTAVAVLRFPSGALASIEASTLTYPENLEGSIALFGTQGSVKVGGTALNRKVFWKVAGELDQEESILAEQPGDPASVYGHSHPLNIADFITAIQENRQPTTSGEEGLKSLKLVRALYQSAQDGREVIIESS